MIGKKKAHFPKIVLTVVMLLFAFMALGFDNAHHYLVRHDGQVTNASTNQGDIKSILRAAKVKLGEHDICTINRRESIVDVIRAKAFILTDREGRTTTQYTTKKTVGASLRHLEVDYEDAVIYPRPKTHVEEGMHVYVIPNNEELVFLEEEIPYGQEIFEDENLVFGEEKLGRRGKPGKVEIVAKRFINAKGKEETVELSRKVVAEPKNEIIRRGMQQGIETPEGWKRYSKKMVAHTTAYTIHCGNGDGLTSIGLVPRVGIVAVDPNVIPYYTKLYIPGYGLAIAGDCGGAIDGNDIDVFVESYEDAIRWGRRDVEVYILEE